MNCPNCKSDNIVLEGKGWFRADSKLDGDFTEDIHWEMYEDPIIEPNNYYCQECGNTWEY